MYLLYTYYVPSHVPDIWLRTGKEKGGAYNKDMGCLQNSKADLQLNFIQKQMELGTGKLLETWEIFCLTYILRSILILSDLYTFLKTSSRFLLSRSAFSATKLKQWIEDSHPKATKFICYCLSHTDRLNGTIYLSLIFYLNSKVLTEGPSVHPCLNRGSANRVIVKLNKYS